MEATKQQTRALTEKTVLSNPELYHTPGYCGFCPQFKFQFGNTFGRTTTRLLANPSVPKSNRTVLADIKPIKPGYPARNTPAGSRSYLKSRKASLGDQKFTEQMVPGYTGYIPKSQHFYGNRYAEICRDAVSQFEQDQQALRKKTADMIKTIKIQHIQTGSVEDSVKPEKTLPNLPMEGSRRIKYASVNGQPSISPYYMTDDDPQKNFMSGYTGFVPNARGLIGGGYPIVTHSALVTFTRDPNHPMIKQKPVVATQQPADAPGKGSNVSTLTPLQKRARDDVVRHYLSRQLPVIYPTDSGLVPNYTGHIPGQKFRYGTTFGHSTKNVKRENNNIKKNGWT